jgi:hypothetical protein
MPIRVGVAKLKHSLAATAIIEALSIVFSRSCCVRTRFEFLLSATGG